MMYSLTNVVVKDQAICTLTPSEGESITVKAPKEMFKSVKRSVKKSDLPESKKSKISRHRAKTKKSQISRPHIS